jgi:DNA repair exonuclease SbcCD ATPase subunit
MAEEKKEKWLNYLALSTVILAVCATLSTFKGGGFSTLSLMNQSKASDQWAFYESKSLKGYMFEMQKDNLELQKSFVTKDQLSQYEAKITAYQTKITQYEKEKSEIKSKASEFEKQRDFNKQHSTIFGIAVIFLQVSILLGSIAALIKKRYLWFLSMAVGCIGIFYFMDGFFLFFI